MYGTRDAARQCDEFSNECIQTAGFRTGKSCPYIYIYSSEGGIGWRHGGDVIFGREVLQGLMILKLRARLGFESGDAKRISILNR
eukprot:4865697-Pyramimonas_sp.AAC.1